MTACVQRIRRMIARTLAVGRERRIALAAGCRARAGRQKPLFRDHARLPWCIDSAIIAEPLLLCKMLDRSLVRRGRRRSAQRSDNSTRMIWSRRFFGNRFARDLIRCFLK